MDRLAFLVEGNSEIFFVESKLIPYLYQVCGPQCSLTAQKIETNRRLHKKGGNVGYVYFENEIRRIAAPGNVALTTLVDFFRLPTDFPGYSTDAGKISQIESAVKERIVGQGILRADRFFPYIQKYEFETLLYARPEAWNGVVDTPKQLEQIKAIRSSFSSPEEINGGRDTSPSNRLKRVFHYDKVSDSIRVLSRLTVDEIRVACPRFDAWIAELEKYLSGNDE